MRNVNKVKFEVTSTCEISFILTMRNVNIESTENTNIEADVDFAK